MSCCERCGGPRRERNRFCSKRCSAIWRCKHKPMPQAHLSKMVAAATLARTGKPRPDASERMKRMNADPAFRARADAASRARKGKSWLGQRGGNGFITEPQRLLCEALGLPEENMEFAISTKGLRGRFESPPTHYKVDIALPEKKLAVEVDGGSHKSLKWRYLDRRKTEMLTALGWRVVRFWNEEVLADPALVAEKIGRVASCL